MIFRGSQGRWSIRVCRGLAGPLQRDLDRFGLFFLPQPQCVTAFFLLFLSSQTARAANQDLKPQETCRIWLTPALRSDLALRPHRRSRRDGPARPRSNPAVNRFRVRVPTAGGPGEVSRSERVGGAGGAMAGGSGVRRWPVGFGCHRAFRRSSFGLFRVGDGGCDMLANMCFFP